MIELPQIYNEEAFILSYRILGCFFVHFNDT